MRVKILQRVAIMSRRQLAEPALQRKKRLLEGGLDSTAKELTAPARLAALEAAKATKEAEETRRVEAAAALKAKQVHKCVVAGCKGAYTTPGSLAKHVQKRHCASSPLGDK